MHSKFIYSFLLTGLMFTCQSWAESCRKIVSSSNSQNEAKVVIISGTNRAGSNTLKVAEQVRGIFEARGAKVTLLDIATVNPKTFSPENYWNTPKSFQKKFDVPVNEADSVVFVFPEYNGTYPGMLGTLINYMQISLQAKPVGIIGLSSGILGAQKGADHLSSLLRHMKADIIGEAQVNLPEIEKAMVDGKVTEKSLAERLEKSAQSLLNRVKQVKLSRSQTKEMLDVVRTVDQAFTFQLNSELQVRGKLDFYIQDKSGTPIFVKWRGPTDMRHEGKVIEGQDTTRHAHGFSSPIGPVEIGGVKKSLSTITSNEQLAALGIIPEQRVTLKYTSGAVVEGTFKFATFSKEGNLQLLTLDDTLVTLNGEKMYDPSWGVFDLAIGETIDFIQK